MVGQIPKRLAVFTLRPWAFVVIGDWASRTGHDSALLVTSRAGTAAAELASKLPFGP
jgi:hypothetical protein